MIEIQTTPDRDAVISMIYDAFSGVSLGTGISLLETECLDAYEPISLELRKKDELMDWTKIINDRLTDFTETFCFTDHLGYRFYIAPYMIWSLQNAKNSDSIISDYTIYAIDPYSYQFKEHSFRETFTDEQVACIECFLLIAVADDYHFDANAATKQLTRLRNWKKQNQSKRIIHD